MPHPTIEVCVASVESAVIAQRAGAHRIELNQALELEGLTPSAGLLHRVREHVTIPIITMARPRGGNFCYSDDQWSTLTADANWAMKNGASGIAFGALVKSDSSWQIDLSRCRQMRDAIDGELVFHKAFDEVGDPAAALDRLIEAGIDRVMTSGLATTAIEGSAIIANLMKQAHGRIEILPAGRVGSANAADLLAKTGCNQLHGSFSESASGDLDAEIRAVIDALDLA